MTCLVIEALSSVQGGSVTYIRELLNNYMKENEERLVVIVPEGLVSTLKNVSNIDLVSVSGRYKSLLGRAIWLAFVFPKVLRRVNADVVYCPNGILSIKQSNSIKTIVACRNMLPLVDRERARYPLGYTRTRLWLLKKLHLSSYKRADKVIFVSEYGRSVVSDSVKDNSEKYYVIPHGVHNRFRRGKTQRENNVSLPPYVLYVSTLDYYKAQVEVVHEWSQLRSIRSTKEKLVLIGPRYMPYARQVEKAITSLGLSEEVLIIGSVDHSRLCDYYQNAEINLFASSCENCPNILLEMMASGRPVLASKYPPMPEFGADFVQYFNPYHKGDLASNLVRLLDNPDERLVWANKASVRSDKYSWNYCAEKTWSLLRHSAENTS